MNKLFGKNKIIVLLTFVSVIGVCFYLVSADGELKASTMSAVIQDKGMSVEEFQKKVSRKDKIVLVYFNAPWCVPCLKLKPEIAALENETRDYCEVLQINIDDHPVIADYYEINSLPMFVLYKNGSKHWENIGALTKNQLLEKIDLYK
ncbi:MAG: thioredoxin family protein [Bacteroidetes bacterium]|nr:thioredoxin family protein [Bacteroidota bacterium]